MFFYLSKLALLFLQPSSLCLIAIAAGLGLAFGERRRITGIRLATVGFVALLFFGLSPVSNWLLRPLEERFARADITAGPDRTPPVGIIILGGFEDTFVSRGRRQLALNEAAERLTEGVRLAQRLPQTRVVFTGGTGDLFERDGAAELVGEAIVAFGIARERVVLEGQSRTTAENATMTRDLIRPKPGETWILVTSAAHMPRAIGAFRAAGFAVKAWPVDYRTAGVEDLWHGSSSLGAGLKRVDETVKEWIGLAGYYATGRSSALFPAP
jgi:uncharacterized SAM-binding protein YcdF (DUF218 family)